MLSDLPNDILDEISRNIAKITDKRVLSMTSKHFLAILKKHVQLDILEYSKIDINLNFKYNIDYEKAKDGYYNLTISHIPSIMLAYCGLLEPLKKRKHVQSHIMNYAIYGNQPIVLRWLINLDKYIHITIINGYAIMAAELGHLDCLIVLYEKYKFRVTYSLCYSAIPHHECLKYILDINKKRYCFNGILYHTIKHNSLKCFKLLEIYDANSDEDIKNYISAAKGNNSTEIVNYLQIKKEYL